MRSRGKLLSDADAVPAKGQHKSPCSDCPFRKDALSGWLGAETDPNQYLNLVRFNADIGCHVLRGAQCAGAAIYRTHTCQLPPPGRNLLKLPASDKVFKTPMEFIEHHKERKLR
jgi:hypothetical protein